MICFPSAAPPNSFTPLAPTLELDDDTNVTPPGNDFDGFGNLPNAPNTGIGVGGLGVATTTSDVVDMGASSFHLLQYARNTTDSIRKLKGVLALADRDHKQDIVNAYASIQAMLNQLTPTVLSNKAAVVKCTKTIKELPDRVADAVLPKITATINSTRDDLSLTMASTMMLASNIFGTKMD
jgi:hypothetical protein